GATAAHHPPQSPARPTGRGSPARTLSPPARPPGRSTLMSRPTTRHLTSRSRIGAALLVLPLVAALAACSSSNAEEPGGNQLAADAEAAGLTVNTTPDQDRITTTESAEAIALLPEAYQDVDTLKVAV